MIGGSNKDRFYVKSETGWIHRSPIKVLLNPALRKIQFWSSSPVVIASVTNFEEGIPRFVRYVLKRVTYK